MESLTGLLTLPGEFYLSNFSFLAVFLAVVSLATLPFLAIPSLRNPLLLLPLGFANLLALLAFFASLRLAGLSPDLVPLLAGLLALESLPLLKSRPQLKLAKLQPLLLPLAIYVLSFIWFSSGHYDPVHKTFFVPGFEINHDAISLLTNVRLIQNPELINNQNPAINISAQSLAVYPSGGSYLTYFFAKTLNLNPYQFYTRLIIAGFLLVLFPLTTIMHRLLPTNTLLLPKTSAVLRPKLSARTPLTLLLPLILLASVLNYLSVSFIDTAVMGSVVILPLILTGIAILNTNRSHHVLLIVLIPLLTAGIFLYSYILPVYLDIVAVTIALLRRNLVPLIAIILASIIALLIPANLYSIIPTLTHHITSTNPETNLFKGMRGNTAGFTNPLMPLSLWFSSDSYLQGTTRIGNLWLVTVLLSLTLPLLYLKKTTPKLPWKPALVLFAPFFLLTAVSFTTRSPYQHAKMMHHFAILWPLALTLLLEPFLYSSSLITRRYSTTLLTLVLITNLTSASYARTKIHPPLLDRQENLQLLAPKICAQPVSTLFIGPDEWARYFLATCPNINFFLDRAVNPSALMKTAELNAIHTFRTSYNPASLKLPPVPQNFDTIILDEIFDPSELTGYQITLKSNSYYVLKKIN